MTQPHIEERTSPPRVSSRGAVSPDKAPRRRLTAQLYAFAAIGVIGYIIDAGTTYAGAEFLGLSPELARPPGFILATIVNFLLNRSITFQNSGSSFMASFLRYWIVAGAGLAVNYSVYSICVQLAPRIGLPVTPLFLPLFVAVGVGAAMMVTFVGFRYFAFAPAPSSNAQSG